MTSFTYAYRITDAPNQGFVPASATEMAIFDQAFALWETATGFTFTRIDDGNGYSDNAQILIGERDYWISNAIAAAMAPGDTPESFDIYINNTNPFTQDWWQPGYTIPGNTLYTALHEIGHTIGMVHLDTLTAADSLMGPLAPPDGQAIAMAPTALDVSIVTYLWANNTINGTTGSDTLYGTYGDNIINGKGGNDTMYGGMGNDRLNGAGGIDSMYGQSGADVFAGSSGDDTFYFGTDADVDSGLARNGDTVRQFVHGQDVIDLNALNVTLADIKITTFNATAKTVQINTDNDAAYEHEFRVFYMGAAITKSDFDI